MAGLGHVAIQYRREMGQEWLTVNLDVREHEVCVEVRTGVRGRATSEWRTSERGRSHKQRSGGEDG